MPYWGEGYFDVDDATATWSCGRTASARPVAIDLLRAGAAPAGRGPGAAGAGALHRHPARPRRRADRRLRRCHRRTRLRRPLHRGLSDQGQPAARRGRGDRRATAATASASKPAASPSWPRCWAWRRAGSVIVCNGYKDRAYIRRALIGQKLGHRVYIVVEKLSELPLVIEESQDARRGAADRPARAPGGDRRQQVAEHRRREIQVRAVAARRCWRRSSCCAQAGRLDAVRMVHFHLGSQVANVQDIAARHARGGALLRRTARARRAGRRGRRRRRPRRGLRGHALAQLLLDELLAARVRAQHRAHAAGSLRRSGRARAAGDHQRIRPRADRAPRGADHRGDRRRDRAARARRGAAGRCDPPCCTTCTHCSAAVDARGPARMPARCRAMFWPRRRRSTPTACSRCRSAPMPNRAYYAVCRAVAAAARSRACARIARRSTNCAKNWPTSTSAISRCSSRCPMPGRSTRFSRSCRSTGSTSVPTCAPACAT